MFFDSMFIEHILNILAVQSISLPNKINTSVPTSVAISEEPNWKVLDFHRFEEVVRGEPFSGMMHGRRLFCQEDYSTLSMELLPFSFELET